MFWCVSTTLVWTAFAAGFSRTVLAGALWHGLPPDASAQFLYLSKGFLYKIERHTADRGQRARRNNSRPIGHHIFGESSTWFYVLGSGGKQAPCQASGVLVLVPRRGRRLTRQHFNHLT